MISLQDVKIFPDWLQALLVVNEDTWDDFYYRRALEPLTNYGLLRPVPT